MMLLLFVEFELFQVSLFYEVVFAKDGTLKQIFPLDIFTTSWDSKSYSVKNSRVFGCQTKPKSSDFLEIIFRV